MYEKNPDVSWRRIEGQAVLVHNRLGEVMVLNEVGTYVWEHLEEGIDGLVDSIVGMYGIEREVARNDVNEFMRQLVDSQALVGEGKQP